MAGSRTLGGGDLLRVLFVAARVHGLFVADALTFIQRVEACTRDLRAVKENLGPIGLLDEPETAIANQLLDRSCRQVILQKCAGLAGDVA